MVAHQTIGPYLQVLFLGIAFQQFKISLPIFVIEEDRGTIIPALRDVMWISWGYDPWDSWHKTNATALIELEQQKYGECPQ